MSQTPPRKTSPVALLYTLLGVIGLGGGAVLLWQLDELSGTPPALQEVSVPANLMAQSPGVASGSADAPVTLMEFGDFECRPCAHFARSVLPQVRDEYVRSGRVRYVYQDFPITANHRNAVQAAQAARCAHDQRRFTEYHDLLFADQGRWAGERNPETRFEELAGRAGLDRAVFGQCMRSNRHAGSVRRSQELGTALGVRGTPPLPERQTLGGSAQHTAVASSH
jgi:protein-disulfide isomerase